MSLFHAWIARIKGKNLQSTPKEVIIDQMNEPRPLPMGRQDFDAWSDRIIAGAIVPGGAEDPQAFIESQKFALAEMIMHLGKHDSHKPDAFFIHALRKGAINQVAYAYMTELKKKADEKKQALEEEAAKASELELNEQIK